MERLERFGWNPFFHDQWLRLRSPIDGGDGNGDASLTPARIITEHRGSYEHLTATGTGVSELDGAIGRGPRLGRPAVGDWVLLDGELRIRRVLDRQTQLVRRAVGRANEPQVIAANVDRVFVVTAPNRDLNERRVERYLAAIWDSGAVPIVVLNKIDLCTDREAQVAALAFSAPGVTIVEVSALAGDGVSAITALVGPGQTVAFVGSSGVGKSTLLNALLGRERQDTGAARVNDDRGRHTTTRRELVELPGGGMVIDTPGMRELGLWLAGDGLADAFGDVSAFAAACRFADCLHEAEPGCAVRAAVDEGRLDPERLESLRKLEREQAHQLRQVNPAVRYEEQRRVKQLHKHARRRDRTSPKAGR